MSGNLDASNNSIIDGLANQQAASEEIAANAQSSADLCETNLNELNGVIDELNEIAKIIGSLRAADLDEINQILEETTVQAANADTTDYSDYFSEDDGQVAEDLVIASEEEAESEETDPTEETEPVETDSTEGVSEETGEDFGDSQAGIDEAYESWEDAEDSGENSEIEESRDEESEDEEISDDYEPEDDTAYDAETDEEDSDQE